MYVSARSGLFSAEMWMEVTVGSHVIFVSVVAAGGLAGRGGEGVPQSTVLGRQCRGSPLPAALLGPCAVSHLCSPAWPGSLPSAPREPILPPCYFSSIGMPTLCWCGAVPGLTRQLTDSSPAFSSIEPSWAELSQELTCRLATWW